MKSIYVNRNYEMCIIHLQIISFPFYIQAERDAHVLLTEVPEANREANEYEIRKYPTFLKFKFLSFSIDSY